MIRREVSEALVIRGRTNFCCFFWMGARALVGSCCLVLSLLCGACASSPVAPPSMYRAREIPDYIRASHERLAYLVEHYWHGVALDSSSWQGREAELRQFVSDYLALLSSQKAINKKDLLYPLEHATDSVTSALLLGYYKDAFASRTSHFYNELAYRYTLLWVAKSLKMPLAKRWEARSILMVAGLNAVGEEANDFVYEHEGIRLGFKASISTPHTLLVFARQGNHRVQTTIAYLKQDTLLRNLAERGSLSTLVVYLGEASPKPVPEAVDSLSARWIKEVADVTDSIRRHRLYHIESIPSIYLIGSGSRVLLRNTTIEETKQYLLENETRRS